MEGEEIYLFMVECHESCFVLGKKKNQPLYKYILEHEFFAKNFIIDVRKFFWCLIFFIVKKNFYFFVVIFSFICLLYIQEYENNYHNYTLTTGAYFPSFFRSLSLSLTGFLQTRKHAPVKCSA